MLHAKRSSAAKMHGGRPRNSLRSNSLGHLSAVCIRAALNRMAHVALATCPTRACHINIANRIFYQKTFEMHTIQGDHSSSPSA